MGSRGPRLAIEISKILLVAGVCSSRLLAGAAEAPTVARPSYRGWTLTAALQALQARGLSVVFSSRLVRPTMRVEREPEGDSPRELLDSLLAPHGLRAAESAPGRLVVVSAPAVTAVRGVPPVVRREVPRFEDEIVVTSDSGDPSRGAIAVRSVPAAEAERRPSPANDLFHAVGALPGTAVRESSSRVHVRGGSDDDLLILLDGLELLAPYHLQEFDSALSIVAPTALARAELISGGYSAEYGDRMGGVLDLRTTTPSSGRHGSFGLGLAHAEASGSGRFGSGRGAWHASVRGGAYRLALELGGRDANPRFWDALGKIDFDLRSNHTLRLNALAAEDRLGLEPSTPDAESYRGDWINRYAWWTHFGLLGPSLSVESIASVGELERNREGSDPGPDDEFRVRDFRSLRRASLKQQWRYDPAGRASLAGGFELHRSRSTFDYSNQRALSGALAPLRARPADGSTDFAGRFEVDRSALFSTVGLRRGAVRSEIGLRLDRDGFVDEEHLSPRLNLAWSPAPDLAVRLAWGWFSQSQRPNELQVEDDETSLWRAERAEHRALQFERRLASNAGVRLELFERRVARSRPRFENLFDPVSYFPELEEDRVRLEPERGLARGVELGVQSARTRKATWRFSYTWALAEETIDGRPVPRSMDQRHSLHAGLGYRTGGGWAFDAAWNFHTGWPTTAVRLEAVRDAQGGIVFAPVLGPLHGERLPAYHRLDLRVSRVWSVPRGRLSTYVDLRNLYDRENRRGATDFRLVSDPAAGVRLSSESTTWGGFQPSFGLRWSF